MIPLLLVLLGQADAGPGQDRVPDPITYRFRVDVRPSERLANVRMQVSQAGPSLKQMRFHIDPERHINFDTDTPLEHPEPEYVVWTVPEKGGVISWTSRLDHLRDERSYDARIATSWAIFRGSDLVPPAASDVLPDTESTGTVRFNLPNDWDIVTQHRALGDRERVFQIESNRIYKRPAGWLMMGEISIERAEIAGLEVTMATTGRRGLNLIDVRTFLRWTLPELIGLVDDPPDRLVIVGAGDPMWRGGLSGPSSLFLHADRPLVASDGTSPVLHELVHVLMGARAAPDGDWVVEGLAELYALQVLYRSGGLSEEERDAALRRFRRRGRSVENLRKGPSTGRITAKAAYVLSRLDEKIRDGSDNKKSLDDVVRILATQDERISTASLEAAVTEVLGEPLAEFFAANLPRAP